MSFPKWTFAGVLPPIRPGKPGHDPDRSPYQTSLGEFVTQMGYTSKRLQLLEGFLNYRAELHKLGLKNGFQWIDGSFLEQIEVTEKRDPGDIDVVTFFRPPAGIDIAMALENRKDLSVKDDAKRTYFVDPYFMTLGLPLESWNTKLTSYWYSMWSHRRDGLWKGFLQIELNPASDADVRADLDEMKKRFTENDL